ncbi:SPOR domain-containing protein [Limnohabitans sp. 2KL-1]|jgi:DedD protein|uniref:SPOR domain-containing protein n=1 Tax=Limnohabitans sp. 2KL-1 TaxID=1100699 RepID=UPI000D3B3AFC|nr:SPOR domain-containing protein [Limnohabitans sp. 2KL-1]PUE44791.1 SPOR domain-containing protein [Limnohabitans sp. 2KL-1]
MAFFKFRLPGQAASTTAPVEAVVAGPSENIEVVRKRARHRLIGAVVLVLIGVVGFPLMFDTQPRPVAVDTPIVIADRQAVPALTPGQNVPAEQAPAKPLLSESRPLPAKEGLSPHEEVVQAPQSPAVMAPVPEAPTKAAAMVPKAEVKTPVPKPEPQTATGRTEKTDASPLAKPKDDGSKAKSLLDGKSAAAVERHVVQVGAFTDPVKVREVRRKLEQAGLSTFTQVIDGKDGKASTRVRVGPFDSREEADKVAARIRRLDLSAAVLRL